MIEKELELEKLNTFIKEHDLNVCRCQKSFNYTSNPIGKVYNKWTVLEKAPSSKSGASMYLCRCECGEEYVVKGVNLFNGVSTRCRLCSSYNLRSKALFQYKGVDI